MLGLTALENLNFMNAYLNALEKICNPPDKTNPYCIYSLISGKTWYSVGSAEIPKNLYGTKTEC